jgi:glycerophosphoryl diester phosphodiesterase
LLVHPYTLRADSLPDQVASLEQLFDILVKQARVDGLFTDFPDRAITARDGK